MPKVPGQELTGDENGSPCRERNSRRSEADMALLSCAPLLLERLENICLTNSSNSILVDTDRQVRARVPLDEIQRA